MTTRPCAAVMLVRRFCAARNLTSAGRVPPCPILARVSYRKLSYSSSTVQSIADTLVAHNDHDSAGGVSASSSRTTDQASVKAFHPSLEVLAKALISDAGSSRCFPAHTLKDSLIGVDTWPISEDFTGFAQGLELEQRLVQHLSACSVSDAEWLAFRNALLATTWPETRSFMREIADEEWPGFVFTHAVTLVTTISEASDALAVLASTRRRTSSVNQATDLPRQAFRNLSDLILTKLGGLNLIPRLTQVFGDLTADLQFDNVSTSADFVTSYATNLCQHADERARTAVLKLLEKLPVVAYDENVVSLRQKVIRICLDSEKLGARSTGKFSRSSHRFCNGEFMDQLIPQIAPEDGKTRRWAHRVAIAVAGRERKYHKIDALFDQLLSLRSDSSVVNPSDLLLYAKALARTRKGGQTALRALAQADQALSLQQSSTNIDYNQPVAYHLDLLGVISKNSSISINSILSMIGIRAQNAPENHMIKLPPNMEASSGLLQAMPASYTPVMQGLIIRGEFAAVPKVWRVMLDRHVTPTVASLSLLLQAVFRMGQVRTAMQQLKIWLEQGVLMPKTTKRNQDTVTIDLSTSDLDAELAVHTSANGETSLDSEEVFLKADPLLATVVFTGLHECGSHGIESLWTAYSQTILLFPDSPILSLLLKSTCGSASSASVLDPSFGREVFKSLLFGKHPELQEYRNPLCLELGSRGPGSWLFSEESPESKMERWFTSLFKDAPSELAPVVSNSDRLIFNTQLFDHYVRLLLHLHHSSQYLSPSGAIKEELLNTLGYMKELSIRPSHSTIALTILEIEECVPPPLAVKQMQKVDAWIVDWLGVEQLPTEQQMKLYWSWKMARNERGVGWFDRILVSEQSLAPTF